MQSTVWQTTYVYQSWCILHVPIGTEENNMCLFKLRKPCFLKKKNIFTRNCAKSTWLCTKRSIKTEDFRPWTTHPESESLWDILHILLQMRKTYIVLLSLWLYLARRQPPSIASQHRLDLDSWDSGLLFLNSLVWCYCWLFLSDYYCY